MRTCCRIGCSAIADKQWGKSDQFYCVKHYRFAQMKGKAGRDGKAVPTDDQLEQMLPSDFACPSCRRPMNWLAAENASCVVSLQHDRCGTMRILCVGCNSRHAKYPGDDFYSVPLGHKLCPTCGIVKPLNGYHRSVNRPNGIRAYCKPCARTHRLAWRRANRELVNAMNRESRKRRIARAESYANG